MSDKTGIEWCDATWNPVTGCTEVTPGCDHCYAKTFAERWRGTEGHYFENGFDVQLRPDKLDQPLRWKRPRRIFVNSMSDLFHDSVPDDYIARVFAVMADAERHTFQVLTKRHARLRALLSSPGFQDAVLYHSCHVGEGWDGYETKTWRWPLPNVWLGVSAENQQWADIRIPALLDTPAAVRFVSAEPLLGPIDLNRTRPHSCISHGDSICPEWLIQGIDWVIVGGESGRGARPMAGDWARNIGDQCAASGVAFLFKQWGEWRDYLDGSDQRGPHAYVNLATGEVADEETAIERGGSWTGVWRFGKKGAGRMLDGRTWDQYPAEVSA
jgi:protein gp37